MANRMNSIKVILERSEKDLSKIEQEYNKSLHEKMLEPDLKIDIKNYCGNMRSVLDYLAREIREKYCLECKSSEIFYFPITQDASNFSSLMQKWLPDLQIKNPDLYTYLESIQPYKSNNTSWLSKFNKLNNENKHGNLVEQTRTETKVTTVSMKGGGKVTYTDGVKFSGGVYIGGVPVDPTTQRPIPHPSQKVEVITWVDFRFEGINASALLLLKESDKEIRNIVKSVEKWM